MRGVLRRSSALWISALLVGLGCSRRDQAPPPAPRPLVTIVVDQMAAWLAADRWPQLPADGGFRRLLREGTYFPEMRYAHAVTDTAPGHAALYTANVPRANGIFANEVVAPGGRTQSILQDAATRLAGVDGATTDRAGSSLARLRGETLADAFRKQRPDALIFSFSLKDRGALIAGGRAPTAVLWLDPGLQEMVTSTAFATPPPWAASLGDRAALARAEGSPWALTDAERAFVAAHAETADAQAGEGDYAGLGTTFPHPVGSPKALRATPLGDHLLFSLATAAARAAASSSKPTLIALSLSSHDYVLHVFGPHSWEAWAELARLDRELGDFLRALDGLYGAAGYSVLLTADHGSTALPELASAKVDPWCARPAAERARWQFACPGPRRRLLQPELVAALDRGLARVLGPGPWIEGIADPVVFFSPRGRALDAKDRALAVEAARAVLAPFGIDQVVDVRTLPATCTSGSSVAELVCRSIAPDAPADLYLVVRPGVFFDPTYAVGFGMSHGSPYLYDRAVPLVVRAPGFTAGAVHDAPIPFTTFARTAAALLGVVPPAEWLPD